MAKVSGKVKPGLEANQTQGKRHDGHVAIPQATPRRAKPLRCSVPGEALAGGVLIVGADRSNELLVIGHHYRGAGDSCGSRAQQGHRDHSRRGKEPFSRSKDHFRLAFSIQCVPRRVRASWLLKSRWVPGKFIGGSVNVYYPPLQLRPSTVYEAQIL